MIEEPPIGSAVLAIHCAYGAPEAWKRVATDAAEVGGWYLAGASQTYEFSLSWEEIVKEADIVAVLSNGSRKVVTYEGA